MILIADSGSTKTDWALLHTKAPKPLFSLSKGLNPFFVNSEQVTQALENTFSEEQLLKIKQVYFYGAGCSTFDSKKIIHSGIEQVCKNAEIEIQHDLLAAARALIGNKSGIACILGTGSNACVYNGKNITEEAVSFGFMLGDEGSGNHFGRLLLKAIFTQKAPKEIIDAFKKDYPQLDLSQLLNHLYNQEFPNRFLASFSPFIKKHKDNSFIQSVIKQSFEEFLDYFILPLWNTNKEKIHFQGSIAWNYQDILKEILKKHQMECGYFIKRPIEALANYHKEFNNTGR